MNANDEPQEEAVFQPEDVERRVLDMLEGMLLNVPYEETKIESLQNLICEKVMKMLIVDNNLNYKYIVNCTLIQKRGTNYVTSTSNYIDNNDSAATIVWPKDRKKDAQSKHMNCIIQIYAIYF